MIINPGGDMLSGRKELLRMPPLGKKR